MPPSIPHESRPDAAETIVVGPDSCGGGQRPTRPKGPATADPLTIAICRTCDTVDSDFENLGRLISLICERIEHSLFDESR